MRTRHDIATAELERQRYRLQRMTILKELQKFIREPESADKEIQKISDKAFDSPLTPFLRD